MKPEDFETFVETWRGSHEVFGSTQTDAAIAISFKVLSPYSIRQVKAGISAHLSDPELGRFAPKPADVIKQITTSLANDGRPDADEAWAIAIDSMDEYKTVVLNNEIAKALEFSRGIYLDGDKVGARMAFRSSYDKAVLDARKNQEPVKWFPSMGFDVGGRQLALEEAVAKGRLSAPHIAGLLPEPITREGQKLVGAISERIMIEAGK